MRGNKDYTPTKFLTTGKDIIYVFILLSRVFLLTFFPFLKKDDEKLKENWKKRLNVFSNLLSNLHFFDPGF